MGEMISKPDANPILLAVLNLCLWGGVGYFLMGQKKKAIVAMVYFMVLLPCGIGMIIPWLTAYDAYLLGQKLANGESIGEGEAGLGFIASLPGMG